MQAKAAVRRSSPSPWIIPTLAGLLIATSVPSGIAADWPRWRGPDLNGISKETAWSDTWGDEGPKVLWKARVGTGFSAISVAAGRAYTLGNTEGIETVFCFDAITGKELWKHSYPCELDPKYYDGGPSATPTIDGDKVYTLSRKGHLFCFEASTGRIVWQLNLQTSLGAKLPDWGFASSPLVEEDNQLILNVGPAGTSVDKRTGKVLWSSGKEEPGYATAVPFLHQNRRAVAIFGAKEIAAVDVKDGRKLWAYPWKTSYDVNASDPIIAGNLVYISSGYNRGAAVLDLSSGRPAPVWENTSLRTQMNGPILIDGHLYGIDGDVGDKNPLRCVELKTGKVVWEHPVGYGGLTAANGRLIVINQKGELRIVDAAPSGYKERARAQVLGAKCWTVPVLSDGRLFLRNSKGDVTALNLRKD